MGADRVFLNRAFEIPKKTRIVNKNFVQPPIGLSWLDNRFSFSLYRRRFTSRQVLRYEIGMGHVKRGSAVLYKSDCQGSGFQGET